VGYSEGGLLVDAVRKNPHAVLLLDEIEKAHPSVLNMLLQVMDYGRLTDSQGKKADFRNIILIMTSNAGAADAGKKIIGFEDKANAAAIKTGVNKAFSPEFRNRLTKIIEFNPLTYYMAEQITRKALAALQSRIKENQKEKGPAIQMDDRTISKISENALKTPYGAREIIRTIEGPIKDQIVEALLSPAAAKPSKKAKIILKI
jgi:ATP-dependent Clp protease ATP-binding subunit ClpA